MALSFLHYNLKCYLSDGYKKASEFLNELEFLSPMFVPFYLPSPQF